MSVIVDGLPVVMQRNAIYWYKHGSRGFDIRQLRRLLGLPRLRPLDTWFNTGISQADAIRGNIAELQTACAAIPVTFTQLVGRYQRENAAERRLFKADPCRPSYYLQGESPAWGTACTWPKPKPTPEGHP